MQRRTSPQPLVAILTVLLPVLLVVGIYLGGHPDSLPAPLRDALVSQPHSRVLNQAVSLIQRDYYRPVDGNALDNASLSGLVASLNDRFSNYLTPQDYSAFNDPLHGRRFAGIGMNVRDDPGGLRVLTVYPGTPAARAGIHEGDLIIEANGHPLAGHPAGYGSNLIRGPAGTPVTVTFLDAGRRVTRVIRRAEVAAPVVQSSMQSVGKHQLAWVTLATFTSGASVELRSAIDQRLAEHAQGIVLDLRDNGGGLLDEAVLVSSIFVPSGPIVATEGRSRPRHVYDATGNAIPVSIPVVVLVNGDTASAAEIVTAALQDHHRATVVGAHTFGKGVFQELEPLSNGGALDITVGEYFTPNGRNLGGGGVKRGAGVNPDVHAELKPGATHDTQLDTALRVLASKLQ